MQDYLRIKRRITKTATVGNIKIGSEHPVAVQTMTNTLTTDVQATLTQINKCYEAGAEIVRVSVPDKESGVALKQIVKASPVPIIADIHFHYRRGIEAVEAGAACIRINPGNIGDPNKAKQIIQACKNNGSSIRIGVNTGSLDKEILQKYHEPCPEAMVESAMKSIEMLESMDFYNTKISVKATNVMLMIKSYQLLAQKTDYPLHLGVTEAGSLMTGAVRSGLGIGTLLLNGIGDTIRVSLTNPPEEEIPVAYEILKSLGIRKRGVNIIACPSCARQQFDVIKVVHQVEELTKNILLPISISMLGCVVNGLGEAQHTDIGVTGAGSGNHLIYKYGEPYIKSTSDNLVESIVKVVKEVEKEGGSKKLSDLQ